MNPALLAFVIVAMGGASYLLASRGAIESEDPGGTQAEEAPPSWIEDPASFYDPPREDLLLAVGTAPGVGNLSMARSRAEMDARAKIAMLLPTSDVDRETVEEPEGSFERVTVDGTVRGSRIVQYWTAQDGTVYALCEAPRPAD